MKFMFLLKWDIKKLTTWKYAHDKMLKKKDWIHGMFSIMFLLKTHQKG